MHDLCLTIEFKEKLLEKWDNWRTLNLDFISESQLKNISCWLEASQTVGDRHPGRRSTLPLILCKLPVAGGRTPPDCECCAMNRLLPHLGWLLRWWFCENDEWPCPSLEPYSSPYESIWEWSVAIAGESFIYLHIAKRQRGQAEE